MREGGRYQVGRTSNAAVNACMIICSIIEGESCEILSFICYAEHRQVLQPRGVDARAGSVWGSVRLPEVPRPHDVLPLSLLLCSPASHGDSGRLHLAPATNTR